MNRILVECIDDSGHLLGRHTIVEYAENDLTIEILRELGVDYAQGCGISRPQPLEVVLAQC